MSRLKLPSLPIPLIALLLTPLLPVASAESAAGAVDTAGFWLGFCLLVVVSAAESAASIVWTRFHVTDDGIHPCELSCRVCGREIFVNTILPQVAIEIAENGLPAGVNSYSSSTTTFSRNGIVTQGTTSSACSCFGGMETRDTWAYDGTMETAIEKFFSLMLVPKLLIRRFNPSMALNAPAGLLRNIQGLVSPDKERSVKAVEHAVHLLVGIADIALGIAGLALIPSSPQKLYDTLKDPEAAMTFENYLTLFLLYWLLGALLLLFMIPLRSARRSIQIFGWPGLISFTVASLATVVLFCLGCWKIDYARRHHAPWTPMLSYWIGGASAIGFQQCGIEVFHVFGVVGLVFMLIDTFN